DGIDDHDEQAERREQQPAEQGDQDGTGEPVDEDEDRSPRRKADDPGAAERHDRGAARPERERLIDRDDAEEQDDDREEDRVDHDLDDETTHAAPFSAVLTPRRSRGSPLS